MQKNHIKDEQVQKQKREKWLRFRIIFVGVLLTLLFGGVCVRFFMLQTNEPHLLERAERQTTGTLQVGAGGEHHLDGHRGYIYDRNGYELATSVETPSVYAHPKQIADIDGTVEKLSIALNMDPSEIRGKLESGSSFVWIARKVHPEMGDAVKKLKIHGVGIKRESKRFYPGQELAGQILGFVGLDNVGLEGLEVAYDKELRGGVLKLRGVRDARGRVILTDETPMLNELEGSSIVLTLDQHIQKVTETALERAVKTFDAAAGTAVVMDPYTGEILALANWPQFNPNRFQDYDKSTMRNRAVLDAYEPGSMMKVFSYSSAVDGAHVRPTEPISQEHGKLKIGSHTISDTHTIPNMTAETVVSESSNIGAYRLVQKIGKEKFYQYLRAFGFGERTGIGLSGETPGILWKPSKWAEIMFSNIAFGQGVSVSPLQLACAVSAIANGGELPRPWLVKEIRNSKGEILQQGEPLMRRRVITEKSAKQVREAMARVVWEGTGTKAYVEGYRVGGKTGTAQKVDPRTKSYGSKWMANFVGIAPLDDPNIVVLVMVDEPRKAHGGGTVAAPAFAEIVTHVLPYRGVYPKEVYAKDHNPFVREEKKEETAENATDVASDGTKDGESAKLENVVAENPIPVEEVPAVEETVPTYEPREGMVIVPDFKMMTAYAAIELAKAADLEVQLEDYGFVTSQWPSAGTEVQVNSRVDLKLEGKYHQ